MLAVLHRIVFFLCSCVFPDLPSHILYFSFFPFLFAHAVIRFPRSGQFNPGGWEICVTSPTIAVQLLILFCSTSSPVKFILTHFSLLLRISQVIWSGFMTVVLDAFVILLLVHRLNNCKVGEGVETLTIHSISRILTFQTVVYWKSCLWPTLIHYFVTVNRPEVSMYSWTNVGIWSSKTARCGWKRIEYFRGMFWSVK